MLTKDDIHAIRNANDICVHLNAKHPTGLVRLIKRKPYNAKPFEDDKEYTITATVDLYSHMNQVADGTVQCFAMPGLYDSSQCKSALALLRVGDEVSFRFYPDAHTNQYVSNAGLHADVLYMNVLRNGKRFASFEIDVRICPDNTARMCRGIPRKQQNAA